MLWLLYFACTSPDGTTRSAANAPAEEKEAPSYDSDQDTSIGTASIEVVVISDLNSSYGSTTYSQRVRDAVAQIAIIQPDVVLSTGDMVAGQKSGLDYRAMWDGFHASVTIPLEDAGLQLAVTPGNHDASAYGGYEEERAVYADEWASHRPSLDFLDDTDYPFQYSFSVAGAQFVSLDVTKVGALSDAQMDWLDDELSRPGLSPRIVFSHVPLYPFADGQESSVIGDADLEALLNDRDVSLYLSGHHHAYYPGRRDDLGLVSLACLGSGQRKLIGDSEVSPPSIVRFVIDQGEVVSLQAYAGDGFDEVVPRSALPAQIGLSWPIDIDDQWDLF
jgi:acid phosphatase type 7